MEKGIIFPEALEELLVLRALGQPAAEKASRGNLSGKELRRVSEAMLDLSDRFNGISAKPLADYMRSQWLRAAYLLYFLPANFVKATAALSQAGGFTPGTTVRILDVGAGPGSLSLGAVDYLVRSAGVNRIELAGSDSSREVLSDWRFLLSRYAAILADEGFPVDLRLTSEVADATIAPAPGKTYDVVLFGDVLNELYRDEEGAVSRRARLLAEYSKLLAENGSLVVVEPALKTVTRALQQIRDILLERHALHIWAPCVRRGACPLLEEGRERDWCHSGALWMRPKIVRRIDELTGRKKFIVKFSYLVVRREAAPPLTEVAGKSVFRTVGSLLDEKGKLRILLCGEPGCRMATLLKRGIGEETIAFAELRRGDIVAVDSWEEKKDGWRLSATSDIEVLKRFSDIGR